MGFFAAAFLAQRDDGALAMAAQPLRSAGQRLRMAASGGAENAAAARVGGEGGGVMPVALEGQGRGSGPRRSRSERVATGAKEVAAHPAGSARRRDLRPPFPLRRHGNRRASVQQSHAAGGGVGLRSDAHAVAMNCGGFAHGGANQNFSRGLRNCQHHAVLHAVQARQVVGAGDVAEADMVAAGDCGEGFAGAERVALQSEGGRGLRDEGGQNDKACNCPLESVMLQIGASFSMAALGAGRSRNRADAGWGVWRSRVPHNQGERRFLARVEQRAACPCAFTVGL